MKSLRILSAVAVSAIVCAGAASAADLAARPMPYAAPAPVFNWNAGEVDCSFFCTTTRGSATLDGLLIGFGLEYAFFNNWTAKFEYDYLGFGSKNVLITTTCSAFCIPLTFTNLQSVSADKHIFKVGLNYKF